MPAFINIKTYEYYESDDKINYTDIQVKKLPLLMHDDGTMNVTLANAAYSKLIDALAEGVRIKYITDGSGQVGTYLLKLELANTWKTSGYVGVPPKYVSDWAKAIDKTNIEACDDLCTQGNLWSNVLAPMIENARLYSKVKIQNATLPEALNNELVAGIGRLLFIYNNI